MSMIKKLLGRIDATRAALDEERRLNQDEIQRLERSLAEQESLLARARDIHGLLDSAPKVRELIEGERATLRSRRQVILGKIARKYISRGDYRTPVRELLDFTLLEFNLPDIAIAVERELVEQPKAALVEIEAQISGDKPA